MSLTSTAILAEVRHKIADEFAPYRWSDTLLNGYIADGVAEIQFKRPDTVMDSIGDKSSNATELPDYIKKAIVYFVCAKAFEGESEDQADNTRCQQFNALYEKEMKQL